MVPRILLLGGTGQVGWELRRTLATLGEVFAPPRAEADVEDADALRAVVRDARPAAVVNAAAYTAVDRAEEEPARARRINTAAPRALAEEAAKLGALMVHFSTDYVFNGESERPYREDDATDPLGVYGATKRDGETAVRQVGGPHLIFRTSWIYGLRGHNFLRTMLRLAREREELRIVDDQWGAPTWSRMIAEATAHVMSRCADGRTFALPAEHSGLYHLTAAGKTTWCGFAAALLERDPARAEQRCHGVLPISTAEYPTPARRPRNSVLDNTKLQRTFHVRLPHWKEQLDLCLTAP